MPIPVQIVVIVGTVFAVNVVPAFAPPTWSVLVYFRLVFGLPIAVLAILGALSAAAGRLTLAVGFREIGTRLPARRRASAEALGAKLSGQAGFLSLLLVFLVSPVPSSALFEAAGLARLRMRPLVTAFLIGRLVSYTLYLLAASRARQSLQAVLEGGLVSWPALVVGLISVASVISVVFVDWMTVVDWIQRKAGGVHGPRTRRSARRRRPH